MNDFVNNMPEGDIISKVFLASDDDFESLNELLLTQIKAVLMSYKTLSGADYAAMDESNRIIWTRASQS